MQSRLSLLKQGAWFFLLNTFFLLLIGSRYFRYFPNISDSVTLLYLTITTLSHFAALSFIPFLLYAVLVTAYPNKTAAWICAGSLAALASLILFIDTFVFDLYRFHINRFVLQLLFGGAGSQIFEFHASQYAMVVLAIVAFSAIVLFTSHQIFNRHIFANLKWGKQIALMLVVCMAMGHLVHMWADAVGYRPVTKSSRFYPLYFPATGKRLMLKLGIASQRDIEASKALSINDDSKYLNYPQVPIETDTTVRTNIVLILIDSWNPCTLDSVAMPNIYGFSKECEVYNNHYSGSNGTRTGLFSIFYSIPGLYWESVLASQTSPVFIDALQKSRYRIKTYPSAALTNPPFDRTIFTNVKDIDLETVGKTAADRDMAITNNWLQTSNNVPADNRPLFGFLFYDGLHAISHPKWFKGPFQPEWEYAKYEALNNDIDPTPFLNLYKNSACYIDSLVGKVLADMRQKGLLENSWVIITGDHSQEFNENKKNFWGHNGNYTSAQMQVPMMIRKPGGQHRVFNHWTSHYDILPSIMHDVLKCDTPTSAYSVGKCLEDTTARNWLLVGSNDNYAVVEKERITIVNFDGSYDITDSHLNEIPDAKINARLMNDILMQAKQYYK